MANYKKILGLLLISVILIQVSVTFASAAQSPTTFTDSLTKFINGVQSAGSLIFGALLGQTKATINQVDINGAVHEIDVSGGVLFLKVLAFLLVTLVVYGLLGVAGNPFGTGWINTAVGAIVSIIGIRFLPDGFIEAMTIPSQGLVALIVLVLPLILAFFLIERIKNRAFRKVLWLSYGVIIFILLIYNWDNTNIGNFWWTYPILIIVCGIALWKDGTIQRWFKKSEEETILEKSTNKEIDLAASEVKRLRKALGDAATPQERERLRLELRNAEANVYALEK